MTTTNVGAGAILDAAKKVVCQERTHQHGDTVESFKVIAELWTTYLRATSKTDIIVTVTDVAELMSLLKKVRHIFGDKTNDENFTDDIGYVAIAGMFAGVKPVHHVREPEPDPIRSSISMQDRHLVNLHALETKVRGEEIGRAHV